MIDGFESQRIPTDGAEINLVTGGSGPPLLLLHGYPQTHFMWHKVMPRLAEHFTVVASDLRGYGASAKPPGGDAPAGYSTRAMAPDPVPLIGALAFDRFPVPAHDRGRRLAHRTRGTAASGAGRGAPGGGTSGSTGRAAVSGPSGRRWVWRRGWGRRSMPWPPTTPISTTSPSTRSPAV